MSGIKGRKEKGERQMRKEWMECRGEEEKKMQGVGFEPTPPKRIVPETTALDHSAILASFRKKQRGYKYQKEGRNKSSEGKKEGKKERREKRKK